MLEHSSSCLEDPLKDASNTRITQICKKKSLLLAIVSAIRQTAAPLGCHSTHVPTPKKGPEFCYETPSLLLPLIHQNPSQAGEAAFLPAHRTKIFN
jgi:hypothetical protein